MLSRLVSLGVLGLLLWAAWAAWQPPVMRAEPRPVLQHLADRPGEASELWRVVSRRMIVPKAAEELGQSLRERGLPAILIAHQEQVELHAFDDPRSFDKREDAVAARNEWKKAGFDAELIKPDENFGVALGRLYMVAYAQQLQRRLDNAGREFTYERRLVLIPTWRFTFAPAPYAEASALWVQVQAMGVADPVLMRESRFHAMFGDAVAGAAP
ncbi:MAG: hypothetical protein COS82_02390 [Zetaproteobacteria bacterium CG06_land_8_20_14_3_00_59_53]|nr:MAG: hypothetical protein COX56_06350 [Zetaproteobacteria bacterium CG23_combo_of_CG06-09_8_20_14_all_59_86]PIQ64021.1 MAG: hypothetical protein COV97_11700 [Zetaproteobacteria bacterium CG11_big_fil_rev_8_21_14_0_20_59_439]PIU71240.1 MAG: hypothetical protein COS82_02390 [Zetaproteobacteria bacterium CG06_land_8_20_14_3_00_59_53]PIU96238.1 MAG: hypothetical protein COS62_10200 [Zetaproteobacteria bacterium CG03_land_8_20_14_0_80_59_51]PIY45462.1 MAG: hypothetical protein COZ02_09350 [Zetapr